MNYWLVKSEPSSYSWDDLVRDRKTDWTGVRNYQARNNLSAMKKGDIVLFYHSNVGKEIVGMSKVTGEAFLDPTTKDDRWVAVELKAVKPFQKPVSLATIKTEPKLQGIALVKQGRISVTPVTAAEYAVLLKLGDTVAA